MKKFIFDLQRFDEPPDGGGGGGSSSSSVSWSGATKITSATTQSNQTYSSTTDAECALLVSLASGTVNLVNPTVTKSGGPSNAGDNYNFYGINSGIMAMGGGTVSIVGGNVTTTGVGANAVFSYGGNGGTNGAAGDGTTVYIENVTIQTSLSGSGGIMTTGGGVMVAKNLTIETQGQSSAPIRTDRGGGSVTVTGGSYTSNGLGSPAIYSTAEVVVNDATLTSNLSEGVCIEGQNSVALTNCTLTANNTQTNGNAQFLDAVILYQSQSGDAASGTSTFSMTGGSLVNKSGHLFHVTNTTAIINLEGVSIDDQGSGVLLSVCDDGWTGASNIATLNATGQTLTGDILVGSDSTLTLNLSDSTKFTGNISGTITNNAGTSISTSLGTVSVTLDESSKWYLTGDTYIKSFDGTASNVITGDYNLYVNGSVLDGTTDEDSALKINNTTNATLLTGTALADSILNSGDNVSINALGESDTIDNSGANASILAGDGDDSVCNGSDATGSSIFGGAGNDILDNFASNVFLSGGDGLDSISTAQEQSNVTIDAGAGDDFIYNYEMASAISISAGDGADTIDNYGSNVTMDGGAGNDSIVSRETADAVTVDAGAGDDYIALLKEDGSALINYTSGDGADTIVGFSSVASLQIGDGTGTYSIATDDDDLIVTVGDGSIILDGAASLEAVNILGTDNSAPTWSLDETIATYATSSDTLLTLTNIKTTDGLEVSNAGVVTVPLACLADSTTDVVLDGDNYSLALGDGMDEPTPVKGNYDPDTMTLTSTGKTEGYILSGDEKSISYSAPTYKTLNFSGVADEATASNFYLKGTTLTIGKAAVQTDGTPLELLTDGYTLKFGKGMSAPETVAASYADNVYTTAGKTAGYTLADNTITYSAGTSKEIQFSGVADGATTSNFYLKGTTLTIGKAAVQTDGTPLELLTDGYTLKLGKGMTASETNDGTLIDGVYTYGGQTAGYILSGKSISYSEATSTQLELSGLANEPTAPTDGVMTLQATNFTDNVTIVDNAGEYSFAMAAGNYSGDTLTGSDAAEKILNAGTSLMISTGAGNDSIRNTGGSVTIEAGAGADTIAGSTKADVLDGGAGNDIIWGGKGNDSILGGAGNDSLVGYAGNDTLWGGAGNDTLTGGAGVDTFIYTANTGTDRITDFTSSDLLQILDAKGAQSSFSDSALSGSNLTLTITGGGKVIFSGVSATQTFNINGTTYSISDGKLK